MSVENMNNYSSGPSDPNYLQSSQEYDRHYEISDDHMSFGTEGGGFAMASPDMQASTWRSAYHDMEDLQSIALAYLGRPWDCGLECLYDFWNSILHMKKSVQRDHVAEQVVHLLTSGT